MEEIKVTTGFKLIGSGCVMLAKCGFRATKNALVDLGLGAVKHPVLTLLILAAYAFMFVAMGKARAERDKANKIAYEYQERNDKLEVYASCE